MSFPNWRIEAAFALGRAGVPVGAWSKIVAAANARQRSNEADCAIAPPAWVEALGKRADAAERRLRAWLEGARVNVSIETQTDPRGAPLTVAGVRIDGDGFPAEWFERAERAAYAAQGGAR